MSISRREEILARLLEVLTGVQIDGVAAFQTVARNRGLLDNDARDAVILMDGDETTRRAGDGRGRQKMSPVILTMNPQVFIVMKVRKPKNENLGEDINAYRGAVIRAIADDAQLLALIGPNGDIAYDGCETDLKSGMPMEGQMRLDFSFITVLNPYAN